MIVCGINIVSNNAIFVVLAKKDNKIKDITGDIKKLELKNDEDCNNVISFAETIKNHFDIINPDKIGIIKRNKSGKFSGGAISFKIEGLIQTYYKKNVELYSPHTLRTFQKNKSPQINSQYKYQKESYLLALYLCEVSL